MLSKILHIEPTDACNAACPQCARETDTAFNKTNLHHLTINQIRDVVSEDYIRNLDKMYMCGNYGDPAAGKYTLEIYRYFRGINPNITLGMNTNGGLRNTSWWQDLAKIMLRPGNYPQEYVVFSIDGLEDTNHIYRANVSWDKVIDNARAFISAGGRAHWEMLVFDYNEHQVEQAQQLAKDLGFKWFRTKISKRFDLIPVNFLRPPTSWQNTSIASNLIECAALKESSMYLSAEGILYPCCWLGTSVRHPLSEFEDIRKSWDSLPNLTCKSNCTKTQTGTHFKDQWQRSVEF